MKEIFLFGWVLSFCVIKYFGRRRQPKIRPPPSSIKHPGRLCCPNKARCFTVMNRNSGNTGHTLGYFLSSGVKRNNLAHPTLGPAARMIWLVGER
jgi:hypothetical protein